MAPADDDLRGRIKQLEAERRELQAHLDQARSELSDSAARRATLEEANKQLDVRLHDASGQLADTQQKLTQVQEQLRSQAEELGRLQAVAENAKELQQELKVARTQRDELQKQLVEAAASFESRVGEQVRAAVDQLRKEHEAAAAEWEEERRRLQDRLQGLMGGTAEETRAVRASDLANQFRSVLDELAEPEHDRAVGAALTGLEVEARGILAPPAEGETLPRLVTVDPAQVVDPGALSTVRMRFGLLPRLPTELGEEQPPED